VSWWQFLCTSRWTKWAGTAESEERARERAEVYAEKIMPLMEGME
jgi:hypothetical protein